MNLNTISVMWHLVLWSQSLDQLNIKKIQSIILNLFIPFQRDTRLVSQCNTCSTNPSVLFRWVLPRVSQIFAKSDEVPWCYDTVNDMLSTGYLNINIIQYSDIHILYINLITLNWTKVKKKKSDEILTSFLFHSIRVICMS